MAPHWEKQGLILPGGGGHALAVTHAAIPIARQDADGGWSLYYSSRDELSRSRIYRRSLELDGDRPRPGSDAELILDLGELGSFDDSGVMPSWFLERDGRLYLYYTGWSLGKTVPFYFYIGIAYSSDGGRSFERVSRAPIVGRSSEDPFLTASACVLPAGAAYRMWYVSCERWETTPAGPKHFYKIKQASSADGISWDLEGTAIDFADDSEYAMARPSVMREGNGYAMWFCSRGSSYRLAYAESPDGKAWKRVAPPAGLEPGPGAWDSEMVAYPFVFEARGRRWMLYNGNGYGETGIGCAAFRD